MTIGALYGPTTEVQTQEEADALFERLVTRCMAFGNTREEAEKIERGNIGYYAGYSDSATRRRVLRLFCCVHPWLEPSLP